MTASAGTLTLTEFLTARLDEDADRARTWLADNYDDLARTSPAFREQAMALTIRVLAEVAAKRRIVELHASVHTKRLVYDYSNFRYLDERQPYVECSLCIDPEWSDDGVLPLEYPCEHVRIIASVYASHPDYREEWAL